MGQPHVHKDVIIAWANGAEIQVFQSEGLVRWIDCFKPTWREDLEYRIKPKDIVIERYAYYYISQPLGSIECVFVEYRPFNNVRFTFDAETKELKNIEMIRKT